MVIEIIKVVTTVDDLDILLGTVGKGIIKEIRIIMGVIGTIIGLIQESPATAVAKRDMFSEIVIIPQEDLAPTVINSGTGDTYV